MMERFTGKVALVTGAGTGIGRAVAQRYAAEGAQVLIVGRTEATLSETASASENISYIVADIEKSNEVERIVSRIKEKYGRLDVLVNNAGWAPVTPITKVTLQEYDKAFSINVRALLDMTISEYALYTGRSLATFKRDFTRETGTSPERWLTHRRLTETYRLIHENGEKPSEVYWKVGFKNRSHFVTAFKRQYGCAPTLS